MRFIGPIILTLFANSLWILWVQIASKFLCGGCRFFSANSNSRVNNSPKSYIVDVFCKVGAIFLWQFVFFFVANSDSKIKVNLPLEGVVTSPNSWQHQLTRPFLEIEVKFGKLVPNPTQPCSNYGSNFALSWDRCGNALNTTTDGVNTMLGGLLSGLSPHLLGNLSKTF